MYFQLTLSLNNVATERQIWKPSIRTLCLEVINKYTNRMGKEISKESTSGLSFLNRTKADRNLSRFKKSTDAWSIKIPLELRWMIFLSFVCSLVIGNPRSSNASKSPLTRNEASENSDTTLVLSNVGCEISRFESVVASNWPFSLKRYFSGQFSRLDKCSCFGIKIKCTIIKHTLRLTLDEIRSKCFRLKLYGRLPAVRTLSGNKWENWMKDCNHRQRVWIEIIIFRVVKL